MSTLAIHHAAITVSDMQKSLGFYREIMGLKVIDDDVMSGDDVAQFVAVPSAKLRAVMLAVDSDEIPYVELIQYLQPESKLVNPSPSASDIGSSHFCFLVESMQAEYERLTGLGISFSSPPFLAEGGRFDGEWSAYCYDPDGFVVELWSRKP
jgi:catechol 2,3-dioxygenase-like lactoylglutathione lyase family enzyme